jgi:hypothetical protein
MAAEEGNRGVGLLLVLAYEEKVGDDIIIQR